MQPDLPTNTPTLGCWIGKSQAFGLIAAKCRSATRPLAEPLFGETKPIRPFRTPTRSAKRTQFRLRRQLLVSLKSATSSQSPALGQLHRTNPIPPIPPLAPSGSSLDGTKPIPGPFGFPRLGVPSPCETNLVPFPDTWKSLLPDQPHACVKRASSSSFPRAALVSIDTVAIDRKST